MSELADKSFKYSFGLFISSGSNASDQAIRNLQKICEFLGKDDCQVEVVNIRLDPKRAESERIMAIPTLVKYDPQPAMRIIGDLGDHRRVLNALGYVPKVYTL